MGIIDDIKGKLTQIEKDHDVRILWAIESGSRSWGFESPDSDYDVRFIYVNRPEWYLSIEEGRDVIELPVNEVLDISGWDLRKTFRLFLKSNPVLMEWLVSPFKYLSYGTFRDELLTMAANCFSRKACSYHYLHMAENNYQCNIAGKDCVKMKKYFYVLRPLFNIIWLSEKQTIPPMEFEEAVNSLSIPKDVVSAVNVMLEKKKQTSELGLSQRNSVLDAFIDSKLKWATEYCGSAPVGSVEMDALNDLFRKTITETWQ